MVSDRKRTLTYITANCQKKTNHTKATKKLYKEFFNRYVELVLALTVWLLYHLYKYVGALVDSNGQEGDKKMMIYVMAQGQCIFSHSFTKLCYYLNTFECLCVVLFSIFVIKSI